MAAPSEDATPNSLPDVSPNAFELEPTGHALPTSSAIGPLLSAESQSGSRFWRIAGYTLVNLWLVYHLLAMVIAPLSVPPTSGIFQKAWVLIGDYASALYINHGYHYFAPEPAGALMLGYTLEFADGHQETGKIPNLGIQPRLLYHRHFMLTEQLQNFDSVDPALREKWCRTYALALGRSKGARRVSLSRIQHLLPTMEQIRDGKKLDDPDLYIEEPLGTWTCDK